jgi:hypothetical protein
MANVFDKGNTAPIKHLLQSQKTESQWLTKLFNVASSHKNKNSQVIMIIIRSPAYTESH